MFNVQEAKDVNTWCLEIKRSTMIRTFIFISTRSCPTPDIHRTSMENRWWSTTRLR